MDDNVMRVLQLLQDGKVTAQEAESLISALTKPTGNATNREPMGAGGTGTATATMTAPPPTYTEQRHPTPNTGRPLVDKHPTPSSGLPTGDMLHHIADDPSIPEHDKLTILINATSLLCAVLIIQPIPLADLVILTPIQVAGVLAMSQVMGQPLGKNSANELITSIFAVVGGGLIAQQLMYAGVKLFVPLFGGLAIIPVVYAATYGLMSAARAILEAKRSNQQLSDDEIRRIKTESEQRAKSESRDWSPAALKRDLDTWIIKGEAFKQYETLFLDEQRRARQVQEELDTLTAQMVQLSQQKMDWEQKAQAASDRLNTGELSDEERQTAQNDKEQAERELAQAQALWATKGRDLDGKRSEVAQIYQKLEDTLRDRFGRSYPNIAFSPGALSELTATPYEKLKGIERQISLLQFDPVRANFQNEPFLDATGQEVRVIGVDDDTRLYVTTQSSAVLVRGVGTRSSESRDISRLQSGG